MKSAISRPLPDISHGDHCCLFYSSQREQARVTADFLALGLRRDERCVFVGDLGAIEVVREGLKSVGVDPDKEAAKNRLILTADRDYLDDGHWRTEKMLGFLQNAYDSTLAEGFTALRAAGDVSWQVGPDSDYSEVVHYEALLDVFFVGKRMVGLCEYPKDSCPADTISGILNTHKTAAIDGDLCSNFHYLPPSCFIDKDPAARQKVRAEWMTAQLLRAKRAEEDRDKLRDQLLQSQKMEVVGRLAGGVAHDFNNILTVILGFSEIVLANDRLTPEVKSDVREIKASGELAAHLTRQLLSFSRRKKANPRAIDLNRVLADMERFLRRTVADNIELTTVPSPEPCGVRADAGHLEQVVMNLAVNARDAMPDGGRLVLETGQVELGEDFAQAHPGAQAGPHSMLSVTDTGHGMDEATIARIFEPFFTTKSPGKGTGLGLSTVIGIVRENKGSVTVFSEPGKGATFKVYLPRVDVPAETPAAPAPGASWRGTETVLLAEEDDVVRKLSHRTLADRGYTVLSAISAGEALRFCERHKEPVHLLVAASMLREMPGRDLARQARLLRPKLRVVLTGDSDAVPAEHALLEKPFAPEALARAVREALDAGGRTS